MHDGSCRPKLYDAHQERFGKFWCSAFGGVHEENMKRDAVGPRGRTQAVRGEGKAKAVHEKALFLHHGMIQDKESDTQMTRESGATANTQLEGCRRKTEKRI